MAIAFYTMGDNSDALPECLGITRSQLYAMYAGALGASAHPGTTPADAATILNGQAEHSVNRILFIGHGGPHGFDLVLQRSHFTASDVVLINALEHALAYGESASIEFRACNVGQARSLISAIQTAFEAASHRASLHATSSGYNVRPATTNGNPCQIEGWVCQTGGVDDPRPDPGVLNPPMTIYPLGRNPARGRL